MMSVELNAPMTVFSPYRLDHIHPRDRLRVGDKALQLASALQNGFPVLPGLVIPSTALYSCLQYTAWPYPLLADLADSALHLDSQNPRQLQAVAAHLRETIETAPILLDSLAEVAGECSGWTAPALIVRPSLAIDRESFPRLHGLFDASICTADPGAIAQALTFVWSQLFRSRSLVFWNRSGISLQNVYAGILIQPLYDAIASGEMMIHGSQVQIQATVGLGQAIAEGDVRPDIYSLDLQTYPDWEEHLHLKRYRTRVQICLPEVSPVTTAPRPLLQPSDRPVACLQQIEVEPSQQASAALSSPHLDALVQLARRIQSIEPGPVRVGWTIPLTDTGARDNLASAIQIVRLEPLPDLLPQPPTHAAAANVSPPDGDELQGLAAAPGQAIAPAWIAVLDGKTQGDMPGGSVLVASTLDPNWLPWLHRASGIVTEQGGMTSHAAILARELGIPAVVGVAYATQVLSTGDPIRLDGDRGRVQRLSTNAIVPALPYSIGPRQSTSPVPPPLSVPRSARSAVPPLRTQLLVNWAQQERVADVAALPVDGVGLLRSEFLLRDRLATYRRSDVDRVWATADMAERIQTIAQAFSPRPVFYRTLDLRSHEFTWKDDRPSELNPILGMHGTLSYQQDSSLFDLEMGAIAQLHQAGLQNIRILLPFVRTVEEFIFCYRRMKQHPFPNPDRLEVWIMAEVPSVLFLLPEFVRAGVRGICIGSNDLTQLILGVDRDQAEMAIAYEPLHPAVLAAMQHLIQTAQTLNLPCSICGQAPSEYPWLIERLVSWGITSISVTPDAVHESRTAIARAEAQFSSNASVVP